MTVGLSPGLGNMEKAGPVITAMPGGGTAGRGIGRLDAGAESRGAKGSCVKRDTESEV